MVEFYERPLAKPIPLTTFSKTESIDIPRDRFIQEIILRLVGTYDSTTAPTMIAEAGYSIIRQLRLIANGNDVLRAISGFNLHALNWFDLHGTVLENVLPNGASKADEPWSFALIMPFKINPLDPFDVGALLPAMDFSSLRLYCDWGAVSDLASANVPTDIEGKTNLYLSLREAFITEEEAIALWGRDWEGLIKNYITEVVKTIDATYGEFQFQHDLPTGMILRRTLLKVIVNSLRVNTGVTKYKISQESPVKRDLLEREWYRSQIQDKAEYRVGSHWTDALAVAQAITIDGISIMDYEKLPCIDATGLKKGDIKFKANTGAPTGTSNVTFLTEEFI